METAMLFMLWVLAAIGLTHVVTDSHLAELWPKAGIKKRLKKMREDGEHGDPDKEDAGRTWRYSFWDTLLFVLYCPQCSGWWCGLASGLLMDPLGHGGWDMARIVRTAAYAFAGSFLAPVGAALINFLDVVRGGKE